MDLKDELQQLLQEGVDKQAFPGAHFAVVYGDGRVLPGYVGYKRLEPEKEPLDGTEIYDVASLTKVISTTTLMMKLIDDETVSLRTTVSSILPRFPHPNITVEDILTHSSGLPADIPRASTLRTPEEVWEYIYSVDLSYPTGTDIIYSDIGYILLGKMVETITNTSLSDCAKNWIFTPLEMTDSSYHPDPSRCAPTELREDDVYTGYLQGLVHDEKAFALKGEAGHAGLFSTVNDISKFILMYLQNDPIILTKKTMNAMFEPRQYATNKRGNPIIRAYGFDKPTPGGTAGDYIHPSSTILHTGFTGCNLWMDTKHQVGFVLLSNAVHPKRNRNGIIPFRRKLANIIMRYRKEELQ